MQNTNILGTIRTGETLECEPLSSIRKSASSGRWFYYAVLIGFSILCLFKSSYGIASGNISTVIEPQLFIDKSGQPFDADMLNGKIVLVNFIFTHCAHVCPTQVHELVSFNKLLPDSLRETVQLLSISIDPGNDTPDVLTEYSKRLGADSDNWSFVTGSEAHLSRVIDQLLLLNPANEEPALDDHKTAIWLLDHQGRVMQRYRGAPVNVERLLAEVQQLSKLHAL